MSKKALRKPASSKAAPKGAAIARVIPVLAMPNSRQVVESMPSKWRATEDDEICRIFMDAHKHTHKLVKALRRELYASSDNQCATLEGAQKRYAELSGMLELIALLEKSEAPPGSEDSGAGLGRVNGHVVEHIELERQHMKAIINSLTQSAFSP